MSESTSDSSDTDTADDSDIIYVGNKAPMNYVQATMTAFNEGNDEVTVKARGRAISTAVDTAEILRRRFMSDVDIDDIEISTEQIEDDDGEEINLSSIRITLGKQEEDDSE